MTGISARTGVSGKIVIVSNDVVPGMGVPVSAPGMRVMGLAAGLQAHGFETIVTVPSHRARQTWERFRGVSPVPRGVVVLSYGKLATFLATIRPSATIICNSNYFHEVANAATGKLVFDFFAPKYLEAECEGQDAEQLAELERRKLAALGAADIVILNGEKKRDYARDWTDRSGPSRSTPIAVVNMCYPWPAAAERRGGDGLSVLVAGYYQRWLDYGDKFVQLAALLDEVPDLSLTLLLPRLDRETFADIPGLLDCTNHARTRVRNSMLFEDYADMVRRHDIFVDLFRRTSERNLAMVTRSAVSLGLGVPVVHPDFTEVSRLISQSGAGWLLEGERDGALHDLLLDLAGHPDRIETCAAAARALGRDALDPEVATRPLAALLGDPS